MPKTYSVIFFGTPEFSIPSLEAIVSLSQCKVLAVVTETDKPAGRGHKLKSPAVKNWAMDNGLLVLQPKRLTGVAPDSKKLPDPDDTDALRLRQLLVESTPDIGVTVAYGKILPRKFISSPRLGIINVHASLLPRWRGAAPLQRAILEGDSRSGVCLMQTEYELDTGAVFHREEVEISNTETLGSLHDRLSELGATALAKGLPAILDGTIKATPQAKEGITYAEKWTVADCTIRWEESFAQISRRVRACSPLPGARTSYNGELIKIYDIDNAPNLSYETAPAGTIVDVQRKKIVVACGNQEFVSPSEIQLAGRKRMPIASAMQGFEFKKGDILK